MYYLVNNKNANTLAVNLTLSKYLYHTKIFFLKEINMV